MKKFLTITVLVSLTFLLSGCNNIFDTKTSLENTHNTDILNNSKKSDYDYNDEIANFSTPLTSGSPNRITNIKLTCNKINEYVLKNGETFSFNKLVGPCTAEEGYLEAEIFVNKKIEYALGGGNCQVSTTLYNACLQVPGITITERHEHGRNVDYIEDGKDATVSYNTLDFAFRNDTGEDLKLYASCDDVNVYASIKK